MLDTLYKNIINFRFFYKVKLDGLKVWMEKETEKKEIEKKKEREKEKGKKEKKKIEEEKKVRYRHYILL